MTNDDFNPWEDNKRLEELEEELRARALLSPSDAAWDNSGSKSQPVNPASARYPPPYDLGESVKRDGGDEE